MADRKHEARLTALGTDLRGVTEKTELIMLLEELLGCILGWGFVAMLDDGSD